MHIYIPLWIVCLYMTIVTVGALLCWLTVDYGWGSEKKRGFFYHLSRFLIYFVICAIFWPLSLLEEGLDKLPARGILR